MASQLHQEVTKVIVEFEKVIKQMKEVGTISEKSFNKMTKDVVQYRKALKKSGTAGLNSVNKGMKNTTKNADRFSNELQGFGTEMTFMFSDMPMVFQDTRMGMMAMGNNLQMMVMQLNDARQHSSGWKAVLKGIGGQLMGPTGVIVGISALIGMLPFMIKWFSKGSDEVKAMEDRLKSLKGQAKEIQNEFSYSGLQSKLEKNKKITDELEARWKNMVKEVKISSLYDNINDQIIQVEVPDFSELGMDELNEFWNKLEKAAGKGGMWETPLHKRNIHAIRLLDKYSKSTVETWIEQRNIAEENNKLIKDRLDLLKSAGIENEELLKQQKEFEKALAEQSSTKEHISYLETKRKNLMSEIADILGVQVSEIKEADDLNAALKKAVDSRVISESKKNELLKKSNEALQISNQLVQARNKLSEEQRKEAEKQVEDWIKTNLLTEEELTNEYKRQQVKKDQAGTEKELRKHILEGLKANKKNLKSKLEEYNTEELTTKQIIMKLQLQQELANTNQAITDMKYNQLGQEQDISKTVSNRLQQAETAYKLQKLRNDEKYTELEVQQHLLNKLNQMSPELKGTDAWKQSWVKIMEAIKKAKDEGKDTQDDLALGFINLRQLANQVSYSLVNMFRRASDEGLKFKDVMEEIGWLIARMGIQALLFGTGGGGAAGGLIGNLLGSTQSAQPSIEVLQQTTGNSELNLDIDSLMNSLNQQDKREIDLNLNINGEVKGTDIKYVLDEVKENIA